MSPDEALTYWYSRADYERSAIKPGDLKLDRMQELLHRLSNPHDKLRIIHIAGSKGKGSTAAMFAAVGQAAGLRCGLFTSPHLVDVSERIQINGHTISREAIAELMTEIRPHADEMERSGEAPTFFEIGTAVGFLHFARQGVELAVVEVGLGGRFDSTNVCTPILSVITSISYEHTAILGNTLAQIAFEKAGIIKPGVPVISGATEPEAQTTIEAIARERGSPLLQLGRDFQVSYKPGRIASDGDCTPAEVTAKIGQENSGPHKLGLLGAHQAANASLVIVGARQLGIADAEVARGLADVRWPARLEVFPGSPVVVLDCAHNVASFESLVESLAESFAFSHRTLVWALSSDKDLHGIAALIANSFQRFVVTRYRDNPRSVPPPHLAEAIRSARENAEVTWFDDPTEALAAACSDPATLVVVAGSVFLAGNLRPSLVQRSSR
ncbi:MAG: bifunctional folylpolyglutamate synthase/dihydrofolate synthase [Gemmataceae bacterium]